MNKVLLNYVCSAGIVLSALTPAFSQVPGNPSLQKAKPLQSAPDKNPSKLSTDLKRLVLKVKSGEDVSTLAKPTPGSAGNGLESLIQIRNGRVVIDVTVKGSQEEAKRQLEKAGAKITGSYGRMISATIPVASLPLLEQATQVRFVRPAYRPKHQDAKLRGNGNVQAPSAPAPFQTVYSQGDTAQGSYLARKKYKSDGKGVKVGILSDSYNNLDGAMQGVKNGELPGSGNPYDHKKPVKVLVDLDSGGIDEGRAMAEIVHDVAPGAEIAFNTAYLGQAAFAQGIVDLAKIGCQVITDDILYLEEPFFQDGIIAQAIDKVTKKGVTYFSAAGNNSAKSYESSYRPTSYAPFGSKLGTAHNFGAPGSSPIYFQPVYVPVGSVFSISFQWDQPFFSAGGAGAESDLDVYILNPQGDIIAFSNEDNLLNGDPGEFADFFNSYNSTTFYIALVKYSGPDPSRLKYIMYDDGSFYSGVPIPGQLAPTITGHANSAGAIATAATWYLNTPAYGLDVPLAESYSSLGGTRIYFDNQGGRIPPVLRKKPEITAPDGGNTSFFYSDNSADGDIYPNFFGTSAAAPHAAGVAALMIDAQKLNTITPDQIRGIMSTKTYDMDDRYTAGFDKGFDYNTGTGLIRADKSVGEVRFPNLYIKNLELVSLCSDDPSKTRNWKIVNPNPFEVKVHWFLTGFGQDNKLSVPPGDTYFSTQTGYLQNNPVPNVVILDWEDNFGFTRFDLASATSNQCNKEVAETQVLGSGDQAVLVKEQPVKPEIADVFPNPSNSKFRLYLSLHKNEKTDISLFGEDGKMLHRRNVAGNGIYEIDASGYKPGIYLMKIGQGKFSKTLKLIKH